MAQNGPGLSVKGVNKHHFGLIVFQVTPRGPSESQAVANKDPSGSFVADSFELTGIDEGFRKPYGMSVAFQPIMGKPLDIDRKDS
jgi:hypothetical protein